MPAARLSYVNVFARDASALSSFYRDVFGFPEIEAIRSPIFVGIDAGGCNIGFNAPAAYDMLGLGAQAQAAGARFLLNFDVADRAAVDALTATAVAAGAMLVKPGYETYYGWYQSVMLDPEGNVFRVNTVS